MALIDDFRKQTKKTVLAFLDRLGVNHAVYSTHLKGYEPYLKEKNIFIYIHATSMVIVCLDLCGSREEIADEGDRVDVDPPYYYSQNGSRISPVWQLTEAMERVEGETLFVFPPMDIYGVLLTESSILDAQDMKSLWESKNVKVIDGMKGLRHRQIATNEANNPTARKIIDAILREQPEKKEEDNEINPNDFPKGSVHVIEDFSIPDGNIAQNDKISVKVEILRPIANPREELDKLVGCADIKQRMDELVALTSYNKLMSRMYPNSKLHAVSLHSVFTSRLISFLPSSLQRSMPLPSNAFSAR